MTFKRYMSGQFSKEDKKWQTFNKNLIKYMKENNFFMLGTTYYEMAFFAKKNGKQYDHLREEGYKMKKLSHDQTIQGFVSSGVVAQVEVLVNKNSCDICKKQKGKKLSLNEALNNPPIPVKECTFEPYGCRCGFIPVVSNIQF